MNAATTGRRKPYTERALTVRTTEDLAALVARWDIEDGAVDDALTKRKEQVRALLDAQHIPEDAGEGVRLSEAEREMLAGALYAPRLSAQETSNLYVAVERILAARALGSLEGLAEHRLQIRDGETFLDGTTGVDYGCSGCEWVSDPAITRSDSASRIAHRAHLFDVLAERLRELHHRFTVSDQSDVETCVECDQGWPCPTIALLSPDPEPGHGEGGGDRG